MMKQDAYFGFAKELIDQGLAKPQNSYDSGNLYDLTIQFTYDIPFYLELARSCKGPVLDIGCGTGRLLKPMLQAGIDVTGMDLSAEMLKEASKKLSAYGLSTELIKGDMRNFRLARTYQLIIIPYYSLIYMHTDEDRLQVFRCVYEHLAEGGTFAFDFDASLVEVGESLPWLGLQGIHPFTNEVLTQTVQMKGLNERHRLMNQINYRIGESTDITVQYAYESTVSAGRASELLRQAGFSVSGMYRDYNGSVYEDGDECIIVAHKR